MSELKIKLDVRKAYNNLIASIYVALFFSDDAML